MMRLSSDDMAKNQAEKTAPADQQRSVALFRCIGIDKNMKEHIIVLKRLVIMGSAG